MPRRRRALCYLLRVCLFRVSDDELFGAHVLFFSHETRNDCVLLVVLYWCRTLGVLNQDPGPRPTHRVCHFFLTFSTPLCHFAKRYSNEFFPDFRMDADYKRLQEDDSLLGTPQASAAHARRMPPPSHASQVPTSKVSPRNARYSNAFPSCMRSPNHSSIETFKRSPKI